MAELFSTGVDEAVLMEPMGVAHNAMERLEVGGEAVLIIGSGPIGLFGCSIAKAMGASKYGYPGFYEKTFIFPSKHEVIICRDYIY